MLHSSGNKWKTCWRHGSTFRPSIGSSIPIFFGTVAWRASRGCNFRLSRGVGISRQAVRDAVRRLIARGVVHLVERNCQARHVVRLRLPLEVRAVRAPKMAAVRPAPAPRGAIDIEKADFLQKQNLRRALHEREGGYCFYCLRRITKRRRCLDHVVPHAQGGGNSYRNLVSCCLDCNAQKGQLPAEEFLRWLYRERKLNPAELPGRFRALRALKAGKLKPPRPGQE